MMMMMMMSSTRATTIASLGSLLLLPSSSQWSFFNGERENLSQIPFSMRSFFCEGGGFLRQNLPNKNQHPNPQNNFISAFAPYVFKMMIMFSSTSLSSSSALAQRGAPLRTTTRSVLSPPCCCSTATATAAEKRKKKSEMMMMKMTTTTSRGRRGKGMLKSSSEEESSKVAIEEEEEEDDDDDFLQFLEDSMEVAAGEKRDDDWIGEPGSAMRGEELRKLVLKRYGKLYDTRICQRRDSMNKLQLFLQIMWKFVGQKSFPMTEAEYIEQTDAVAEILTMKNRQDLVRANLPIWPKWPKMDTTGANAVMIPLDIDEEDLTIDGE